MQLQDSVHDHQAQATAPATRRRLQPGERRALEQSGPQRGRYARPCVAHGHLHAAGARPQLNHDLSALGRAAHRVVKQVDQHALHHGHIGGDGRQSGYDVGHQALAARLGRQLELLEHVLHQVGQPEALHLGLDHAVLQPRQLEQLLRQPAYLAALIQCDVQVTAALVARELIGLHAQSFKVAVQRGERRSQVVRKIGEQLAPLLVLRAQHLPLLGRAPRQPRKGLGQLAYLATAAPGVLQLRRSLRPGGLDAIWLQAAHRGRQRTQRPRDEAEGHQTRHQA